MKYTWNTRLTSVSSTLSGMSDETERTKLAQVKNGKMRGNVARKNLGRRHRQKERERETSGQDKDLERF